jgi:hypothetical protein
MRTFRFTVFLLSLTRLSLVASEPDHLLPVNLRENEKYRAVLTQKLAVTSFDCGRLVIRPAFAPEESLSIYGLNNDAGHKYFATYLAADTSLWQTTDEGRYPEKAAGVGVERIDAEIPDRTAEVLKKVWMLMLSGRQAPKRWDHAPEMLFGDATVGEFSIPGSPNKTLYGETPLVPELGSKTKQLVELSDLLVKYCKAKPSQRGGILEQVERQAARLLQTLSS